MTPGTCSPLTARGGVPTSPGHHPTGGRGRGGGGLHLGRSRRWWQCPAWKPRSVPKAPNYCRGAQVFSKYISGNAGGGVSKLVAVINFPTTATVSLNCPPLTALVMVELQELPDPSHLPCFSGWHSNNRRVDGRRQTNIRFQSTVSCLVQLVWTAELCFFPQANFLL